MQVLMPADAPPVVRLTAAALARIHPTLRAPEVWVPALRGAMARYDVAASTLRMAHFLAQCGHESGGFATLSENLNYSSGAMVAKFGRRIGPERAMALGRKPGQRALILEQQREIANAIYGGEWGRRNLGNTERMDGWDFRGAGILQHTGRANHAAIAAEFGLGPADAAREFLTMPGGAAMAAAWWWRARGLNEVADRDDVREITRRVNGNPDDAIEVRTRLVRAWQAALRG